MPDTQRALMVFAAGRGTRMGALTADRPKPLIEVAGRPLIDHALALAEGCDPVVVNTHYHGAQLAAHLDGRGVRLSPEADLLDTGGGLKAALPLLGAGPVFTLNSDAVWTGPNPLATLATAWTQGMEALLLLVPRAQAVGRQGSGDFAQAPDGRLTFGGDLVYTGAQILHTAAVAAESATVFSLHRIWEGMAARGTLYGTLHPGGWADVGHPAGIGAAEAMLAGAGA